MRKVKKLLHLITVSSTSVLRAYVKDERGCGIKGFSR
jgi:hypothetical protein